MAKVTAKSIEIETNYRDRDWAEQERTALETVQQELRAKNDGELVGEILRWQRADGYAQYMVVKQKPLTLSHVAIGDAWQVESALIRGLRLADVENMVQRERRLKELFSK